MRCGTGARSRSRKRWQASTHGGGGKARRAKGKNCKKRKVAGGGSVGVDTGTLCASHSERLSLLRLSACWLSASLSLCICLTVFLLVSPWPPLPVSRAIPFSLCTLYALSGFSSPLSFNIYWPNLRHETRLPSQRDMIPSTKYCPRRDSKTVARSTHLLHRVQGTRRTPAKTSVGAPKTLFKVLSVPFGSVRLCSVSFGSIRFGFIRFQSVPLHSACLYSVPLAFIPFHSDQFQSVPSNSIQLIGFNQLRSDQFLRFGSVLYTSIPLRSYPLCSPLKMKTKLLSTASSSDQIRR